MLLVLDLLSITLHHNRRLEWPYWANIYSSLSTQWYYYSSDYHLSCLGWAVGTHQACMVTRQVHGSSLPSNLISVPISLSCSSIKLSLVTMCVCMSERTYLAASVWMWQLNLFSLDLEPVPERLFDLKFLLSVVPVVVMGADCPLFRLLSKWPIQVLSYVTSWC